MEGVWNLEQPDPFGDLYTHLGYIPTPSIHLGAHPQPQQFPQNHPSLPDHCSNQQHSPSPRPKGPRVPPEKTPKTSTRGKKTPWDSQPQLGVSKNTGTPKWMVYNGKPY